MDDVTPAPEPVGASKPKRRPRETRELKVKYEFVVVNGEEAADSTRSSHRLSARLS